MVPNHAICERERQREKFVNKIERDMYILRKGEREERRETRR
jgi:hypothetical protein